MDDSFLFQLREGPDARFAETLRQRLSTPTLDPESRQDTSSQVLRAMRRAKPVWIAALIAVVVLGAMTLSPVRAFGSLIIKNIAGMVYEVTDDYPGDDHPGEAVKTIEPQVMPLGEALAVFPHTLKLPADLPEGFVLDEKKVRAYVGEEAYFNKTLEFSYGGSVFLQVTDRLDEGGPEIVGADSVEEILLDEDHPAVLIRGTWWSGSKSWDPGQNLRLRWRMDDLEYCLHGNIGMEEALMQMALSMLE